jgi:hypothetical protein
MPDLKPELSGKSKYWIPKHRYYELKHFCLQYPEWKRMYSDLGLETGASKLNVRRGSDISNPTARFGQMRAELWNAMELISKTATEASPDLGRFLLKAVTEEIPFTQLQTLYGIPCGKDLYYETYRKFFWLLSNKKRI